MKRLLSALTLILAVIAFSACSQGKAESNTATVNIRFSRFTPGELTVATGQPVTFTLNNGDPIEHEWIVGTAEVHEHHRTGTEAYHDSRPKEVTIPAFSTRVNWASL